jgi:hypothetical protein
MAPLPAISPLLPPQETRLDAVMEYLHTHADEYDIIGFQEAFTPYCIRKIKKGLPLCGLKHVIHFVSGADLPSGSHGSGCIVASRYPILDTAFQRYSANGRVYRIDQWDWQAGKGIGLARVLLPGEYGTADIYVSHLVAQYHDAPHDGYAAQRALQVRNEMAGVSREPAVGTGLQVASRAC